MIVEGPGEHDRETLTWVAYGSARYQETMARLSLESSEHWAPPYPGMQDYFIDIARVSIRRARKRAGLPASADVGALATVVLELRHQIESSLGITIADAVVASAHLVALYQDDLYDSCRYAGIQYMVPNWLNDLILWETGAACAGYGLNLCNDYENLTACYDEHRQMPNRNILEVHRSRTAITSTLALMFTPTSVLDTDWRRVEDFTLGSDGARKFDTVDQYWSAVKAAIIRMMVKSPAVAKPDMVILTGDQVKDGAFRAALDDALKRVMPEVPEIFDDDVMVIAAKGAAELSRRGAYAPMEP